LTEAKDTTDWLPPIWCKWKSDRRTTHSIHSPHVWPLEHLHVHRPCGTGETPKMAKQQKKAAPKPNTPCQQTLNSNDKVTVNRRFAQDGIYRTMYGIPLGGRGHHPAKALIEGAVKWISAGGLSNSYQSAQ
jgi:hypothetical protein